MLNEIAQRYGEALFSLAEEENAVDDKKTQAETLLKLLEEYPEVIHFFRAVKITKGEKKEFINRVFHESLDQDFTNFLKLLIDKGRISSVNDILKSFIHKCNEYLNIEEAIVYSARELKPEDLDRIKKALEVKTKKTILVKNRIDTSLLAGIKVVVGNNVTDVSMKYKIDKMREALLKGGALA